VLVNQFSGDLARAINADVLDINVANNYVDIAQNRNNSVTTFLQNTQLQYGKYVTPQTFLSLQASIVPGAVVAPGASVIHRLGSGLSLQFSGEPLYLLGPPSLSIQTDNPLTGILGVNVIKVWKF